MLRTTPDKGPPSHKRGEAPRAWQPRSPPLPLPERVVDHSAPRLLIYLGRLVVGTQQPFDAMVVDGLPVVQALRVPAQQDLDAVAGPLGDSARPGSASPASHRPPPEQRAPAGRRYCAGPFPAVRPGERPGSFLSLGEALSLSGTKRYPCERRRKTRSRSSETQWIMNEQVSTPPTGPHAELHRGSGDQAPGPNYFYDSPQPTAIANVPSGTPFAVCCARRHPIGDGRIPGLPDGSHLSDRRPLPGLPTSCLHGRDPPTPMNRSRPRSGPFPGQRTALSAETDDLRWPAICSSCTTSRRRTFFVLTALRSLASSRPSSGWSEGTVVLQTTQHDKHTQQQVRHLSVPHGPQVTSSRSSRGPEGESLSVIFKSSTEHAQ